ncbi:MAG: 30S ribosomal protein S19e, partial [Candidatus Woesearchaeota archaeon]
MGLYEIPKTELIERAAKELQKVDSIKPPQWALFVKTGMFKQRQPSRDDWWFVRAAAILRRLSDSDGPIGVQKLRTLYGGRKNRGHAPERFFKGSGNILRKILQQLEKAGFAKKIDKGLHKGRTITPQGLSFLGKIADAYMKENNIVLP